jgi:hypothetical protein
MTESTEDFDISDHHPNIFDLYKQESSIATTLTQQPLKRLELKNKTPAPEPGDLRVIIITCGFSLDCNINLDLIAHELPIDDQIIGVKLPGVVEKGCFDPTLIPNKPKPTKRKRKNANTKVESDAPKRIEFGNQCSFRVVPQGSDLKLDLKLFGNGSGVITGAITKDYADRVFKVITSLIRPLKHNYQIDLQMPLSALFPLMSEYLKCIKRNYIVFLKMFSLLGITIDLKLDLVLNNNLLHHYPIETSDSTPEAKRMQTIDLWIDISFEEALARNIIISGTQTDLVNYSRVIQVFNICSHYCPNDPKNPVLMTKLNDPNDPFHDLITRLYHGEVCCLPMTFELDKFDAHHNVVIDNYNTMYTCNFHLDREAFTRILNSKYGGSTIVTASYQTTYPGINVKYISRIDCKPDCQSNGQKTKNGYKCPCKEITFLIFQEGKIMITGARSWNQILDGYRINTEIMKAEYPNIMIEPATVSEPRNKKWPAQIIQQIGGQKYVYINKKQQIIENPPNYFILKKNQLLDYYLI